MNKSNVIYDEVAHTYHLNGKQLKGITGTLIPHAIGQKYADVPEHILAEKAKYGKLVHSEIEVISKDQVLSKDSLQSLRQLELQLLPKTLRLNRS